jgi:hypothetical protein
VIYSRVMQVVVRMAVLVFAAVAMAVACGDDDEEAPSATGTASPTSTAEPTLTPASVTASPTEEPFSGGRDPVAATPVAGLTAALLLDIRTGEHAGFDRITFEFDGVGLPGYDVRYADPPIMYDPRGEPMEIDGTAFIVVRMEPAAGHDPDTGDETYFGPLELKPSLPSLLEAERVGDFEGVLSWALGLSGEVDFRVTALENPPRLVIDVGHEE